MNLIQSGGKRWQIGLKFADSGSWTKIVKIINMLIILGDLFPILCGKKIGKESSFNRKWIVHGRKSIGRIVTELLMNLEQS